MLTNAEDRAKLMRGKWLAKITDQQTGRVYLAKGAACSISTCFCDAEIIHEFKADEVAPRIYSKREGSNLSSSRLMIVEETESSYLVRAYDFNKDKWEKGSKLMDRISFHKHYEEAY